VWIKPQASVFGGDNDPAAFCRNYANIAVARFKSLTTQLKNFGSPAAGFNTLFDFMKARAMNTWAAINCQGLIGLPDPFADIFTDEEFMSDVYKTELAFEDAIMKVKSSYKAKDKVGEINVGNCNAFGGGEEEEGGAEESGEEKVLDIQFNFNLMEYQMSKADFMTYIKGYLKKIKEHLTANKPDRVDKFMKGAQEFIKAIVGKYEEYTIYTGSKETLDGGIALSFWEVETDPGPMFYFFKDGLKDVKL